MNKELRDKYNGREMAKIVRNGTKIDFHIHSSKSAWTESGIKKKNLEKCTIDKINVLLEKLKTEEVNLFSISDHDCFDYNLYKALKTETLGNDNLNVLPAVEFSILFEKVKLHVVTIFDDSDDSKIQKINSFIFDDDDNTPKYAKENTGFTVHEFSDIINNIGCDIVTVVHQKQSPNPENVRERDLMSLGERKYQEFIQLNYFDAIEFKNPKNEVFSKIYHNKHNLDECFIVGSDCHDWDCYPNEEVNDNNKIELSYMKSLPTFKGLKMSITDVSRLSRINNFFSPRNYLESFTYKLEGKVHSVELSQGLNVLIGDNSTGKSAILHALTDYPKEERKKMKKKYKSFFKEINVEIKPQIKDFKFNSQGEIRENFQTKKFDLFSNLELSVEENEVLIKELQDYCNERFNDFLKYIKFSNEVTDIKVKTFELNEFKPNFHIQFLNIENKVLDKNIAKIQVKLASINSEIDNLTKILNKEKDTILLNVLADFKEQLEEQQQIYLLRKNVNAFNNDIYNVVYTCIKAKKESISKLSSDTDQSNTLYNENKIKFEQAVTSYVKSSYLKTKSKIQYDTFADKSICYSKTNIREYKLYKALDIDEKTFEEYYNRLIKSLFIKDTDLKNVSIENLYESLYRYQGEKNYSEIESFLKEKFEKKLVDELVATSIVEKKRKMFHSAGLNSSMYFELLNVEDTILIFDQPEDDISQSIIKTDVLNRFKQLSIGNQIIFVTHNAQFIVNLDVDNLIYIKNDDKGFEILNGALEYEAGNTNIIDIVANTVEGGTESIKQRWRRYDNYKINKK